MPNPEDCKEPLRVQVAPDRVLILLGKCSLGNVPGDEPIRSHASSNLFSEIADSEVPGESVLYLPFFLIRL